METAFAQKKEANNHSQTASEAKPEADLSPEPENELGASAGMPLFLQRTPLSSSLPPVQNGGRNRAMTHQHTSQTNQQKLNSLGQGILQRGSANQTRPSEAPLLVHDVLRSPGQSLAPETHASRFGHNFSKIAINRPDVTSVSTQVKLPQPLVQPKLTIGQPGDKYEQEADQVAEQVIRMPEPINHKSVQRQGEEEQKEVQMKPLATAITPLVQREAAVEEDKDLLQTKPLNAATTSSVQRKCAACEAEEEAVQMKPSLQSKAADGEFQASSDIESQLSRSKSGGSPLSDEVRSFMEPRFGTDFGQVRVHTNSRAVQMNRELSAQAFTHGRDIYFGAGKYNPRSSDGKRLLAHELTHVVQQAGAKPVAMHSVEAHSNSQACEVKNVSRAIIQCDLTEEQKQSWKDNKADQFVSQIKDAVNEWKKFRNKPEAFEQLLPIERIAGSAPAELAELLRTGDPAYKQYAAEQLGADSIVYLSEIAAFILEFRLLRGMIPGLAYVNPAHEYKMTTNQNGIWTISQYLPVDLPLSALKVEYSNAFGWYWQKELTGSQARWQVGIGYEIGKGAGGSGMGGEPKQGLKNPLLPQPAGISINTEAKASPVGYWGYKDLAGFLRVVNGPSVKASFRSFGRKVVSGGIISVDGLGGGPPGSLDFMNVVSEISVKYTRPGLGKPADPTGKGDFKKNVEISLTLVEEGVGVIFGGAEQVATPELELEPEPVPEEKIWRYVVSGFETGSGELKIPEGEVHPIMKMIEKDIEDKKQNVESIKSYLEKTGVKQEFKLDFNAEGYASRRWTGAGNNDVRQKKNLELSTRRAQEVTTMLNQVFGPEHNYSFVGKGAAVYLSQPNSNFGQVLSETGNEQLIEQMIRERTEQYMKDHPNLSHDETRKMAEMDREIIEANLGKTSDVPMARRVNITIAWRGYNIKWGAGEAFAPHSPNAGSDLD